MDSATLAKQIADYDTKRRSSVDVLNEAMGKYGVPEIRSRVTGLRTTLANTENALNAVDPSVTGRTQGSLVTEAQRQKQVVNERAPIMEQYGQQERALGNESANMSDALGAAKILAEGQQNDWNIGRQALQSRYDQTFAKEQAEKAFQLEQEKLAEAKRQAAAAAAGYSLGGNAGSGSASQSPLSVQGVSLKDPKRGGSAGYNFSFGGKPISAVGFAQVNGLNPADILFSMANSGDGTAAQAYREIAGNGGNITPQIAGKYAALFWGTSLMPAPSAPKGVGPGGTLINNMGSGGSKSTFGATPGYTSVQAQLEAARQAGRIR